MVGSSWDKYAACIAFGQFVRDRKVIARIAGASARGVLVALLLATPALRLPNIAVDSSQVVLLMAMLARFLTFAEYNAKSPSIVEFRDAGPFNRLRFVALFSTVFMLSLITKGKTDPTAVTNALTSIGMIIGNAIDFPFSPVRLVVLMLPNTADADVVTAVRTSAGLSYLISLIAMTAFLFLVRVLNWPARKGAFNVWINLPLFDPTAGGDVLLRLRRDARFNVALGFCCPSSSPQWSR